MELKRLFLLILIFISVLGINSVFISACEDGQININSASKLGLERLHGIGPVKSQSIIDSRPFSSIDDLINVNGIGPVTLENIKSQGFACVKQEEINIERPITEESEEEIDSSSVPDFPTIQEPRTKSETLAPIDLSPKDIKSEDSFFKSENNYAIYGFVMFSILIGILFLIQKNKYKNEFRRS